MATRIGLIGVGKQGRRYLQAAALIPETTVVALCDLDDDRAKDVSREFGIEHVGSAAELVRREDVDIVAVVTPPATHRELSAQATAMGKHVLCEKPLATDSIDANAMLAAATEAGVTHALGHTFRYEPSYRYVRDLLSEGIVGEPTLVALSVTNNAGREPATNPPWRQDPVQRAGFLSQSLIHGLDLVRFLFRDLTVHAGVSGPIPTVLDEDGTPRAAEDAAALIGRLASGGWLNVVGTWVASVGSGTRWEVFGTEGTLRVDAQMRVLVQGRKEEPERLLPVPDRYVPEYAKASLAPSSRAAQRTEDASVALVAAFVEDVARTVSGVESSGVFATFADGVRMQEIVDAVRGPA